MNDKLQKVKEYNASFYQANKDRISKKRKELYAKDPKYRALQKKRSQAYRQNRRSAALMDREIYRNINGENVRVYSTGMVAELMKCSGQHIRNMQQQGIIPPCTIEGTHLLFTKAQVNKILNLPKGKIIVRGD